MWTGRMEEGIARGLFSEHGRAKALIFIDENKEVNNLLVVVQIKIWNYIGYVPEALKICLIPP